MGTDSKLIRISDGKSIYCDRYYNLDPFRGINNTPVGLGKIFLDLQKGGATKVRILKLLSALEGINKYLETVREELEDFDDSDVFILVNEHDERY